MKTVILMLCSCSLIYFIHAQQRIALIVFQGPLEMTAQRKPCTSLVEDLIEFSYAVIHNPQRDIFFFKGLGNSNEDLEKQSHGFAANFDWSLQ